MKQPEPVSAEKERKVGSQEAKRIKGRIGTHIGHYIAFVKNVMDELGKHKMQGYLTS
jgi:hypothetical protein